jgi:transcriptional regulator with XRE-family HTH domain
VFNEADRRGISQRDLGRMIGLSQSAVSKVRHKQATTLATARDFAQALDHDLIVVPTPSTIDEVLACLTYDARLMPMIEEALATMGYGIVRTPDLDGLPVQCWVARPGDSRRRSTNDHNGA